MNRNVRKYGRRIKHIYKSGSLLIGLEHFLVMFPSAMLIAKLATTSKGSVIELPSILLACGIGTIVFAILTKGEVPFFLGPSFSYIGFVSYQVAKIDSTASISTIRRTIIYGYLIGGLLLLLLACLYRSTKVRRFIETLFPSTVMGPAISLIGLELAGMAAQDSGFNDTVLSAKVLAVITLFCIIVFSLLKHHFLQNASIVIGVSIGIIIACLIGEFVVPNNLQFRFVLPKIYAAELFTLPSNLFSLTIAVIPCTMIAFIESLGRVTVLDGMMKREKRTFDSETGQNAISKHAFTSIFTSITYMMPSAIYAENLAVMNLHNTDLSTKPKVQGDEDEFINNCYSPFSIYPYVIASVFSIVVACINGLQQFFLAIPISILGGMELFVFGLIAAPGIQMLVDQQINYKKISNQIITASVLLAGISNITISYESLTLKGMSLGLTIGVVVNLITLTLNSFGYLNEEYAFTELICECAREVKGDIKLECFKSDQIPTFSNTYSQQAFMDYIKNKNTAEVLNNADSITLTDIDSSKKITFSQVSGHINMTINMNKKFQTELMNDYSKMTVVSNTNKTMTIIVNEYLTPRLLHLILDYSLNPPKG